MYVRLFTRNRLERPQLLEINIVSRQIDEYLTYRRTVYTTKPNLCTFSI